MNPEKEIKIKTWHNAIREFKGILQQIRLEAAQKQTLMGTTDCYVIDEITERLDNFKKRLRVL